MIKRFVLTDRELITNPTYDCLFDPEMPEIRNDWAWTFVPGCPRFKCWVRWWYDPVRMERVIEYEDGPCAISIKEIQ